MLKYLKFTAIRLDDEGNILEEGPIYILDNQVPLCISEYYGYTAALLYKDADSLMLLESPEEVMSKFGIEMDEGILN